MMLVWFLVCAYIVLGYVIARTAMRIRNLENRVDALRALDRKGFDVLNERITSEVTRLKHRLIDHSIDHAPPREAGPTAKEREVAHQLVEMGTPQARFPSVDVDLSYRRRGRCGEVHVEDGSMMRCEIPLKDHGDHHEDERGARWS